MNNYICENCDHINTIHADPAHIDIKDVLDWEANLPVLQAKQLNLKFTEPEGTLPNGTKYTTLYLSKENRRPMMTQLLGHPTSLVEDIKQTFTTHVVPVIDTVFKNFNVLGALATPCAVKLALINLSCPVAVFTFITVEKTPDFRQKLTDLGLLNLTNEGSVETIAVRTGTTGRDIFNT